MDEKTIARFWSKVDKNGPVPPHRPELGPCWIWTACIDANGYGRFGLREATGERAHRVSIWISTGRRPTGFVCHHCDVRRCVRDDHIYLGDAASNHADMVERGRRVNHLGQDHGRAKLTNAQARYALSMRGVKTQVALAAELGISQAGISRIHRGAGWSGVHS